MDKNHDVKAMLEEAQNKLERQFASIDAIKAHARTVFGSSSLVVSLLGALHIFTSVPEERVCLYITTIALIASLYIILIILSIVILSPFNISGPIEITLETLKNSFLNKCERDVIKLQTVAYINAIQDNEPKIITRKRISVIISVILPIIVIFLILASLIPILS